MMFAIVEIKVGNENANFNLIIKYSLLGVHGRSLCLYGEKI